MRGRLSSRQKRLRLGARSKTSQLAISRIMFCRFRRPQHNELIAVRLDNFGQFIAIHWRHMPGVAFRTVIVAHSGPFILPFMAAAPAFVVIAIPSHATAPAGESSSKPQTIVSARHEIEITPISQKLEPLAYLGPYVFIFGIETTQSILICIYVFDLKLVFSNCLDAHHYLDQPPSCFLILITQKERLVPPAEYQVLCFDLSVPHNINLAELRYLIEQDVRANPASAPSCRGQGFTFFDYFPDKEMFWDHKEVVYAEFFPAVIQ